MLLENMTMPTDGLDEPALYTQYCQHPHAFMAALVRQMEMGIAPHMKGPLEERDRQEMERIVRDVCANGHWRFAGGLPYVYQCCETRFLAQRAIRRTAHLP